jgi:uncharacterized protein YhdP
MRSFRWVIISGAVVVGVAILAIAIGVLWLNTYIHSAAFKADVESKASQSVGGPVHVQSVDFDIFRGVKLEGFVTQIDPSHAGGQGALKIQVASVNFSYAWTELLSRRLRLTGLTLDQPQIVLTKQTTEPMNSSTVASTNASTPSGPLTGEQSAGGNSMPFQFVLDRAKINEGTISVLDVSGAPMVDLKGVNASADTSGYYDGKDVTGTLKIADIALPPNLHVTDFSTPFTYRQGALGAKPFSASAFKGKIAGDFSMANGPSILDLNGNGLDVAQLSAATASGSSAKLSGSLDLQSKWRGAESGVLDGEGDVQLTNGRLDGVKFLEEAGQLLKINELKAPIITKAQTHFVVQNRQIKFIGLQLDSPLFRITGDGTADFGGNLNANLVLVLSRDAMGKLPKEVASSFVGQQDGTGSIAFQVTGTTSNPQTDLPQRLLLQNTQVKKVLNKVLDKFFH